MQVIEKRLLRGPNIYAWVPCIKVLIDLGDLAEISSADLPGFGSRLGALLPSLPKDCYLPPAMPDDDPFKHADPDIAYIIGYVLRELQCIVGPQVSFGRVHQLRDTPGCYQLVCPYHIEALIEPALDAAMELMEALVYGKKLDIQALLDPLRTIAGRDDTGHDMRLILARAQERGIPTLRLTDGEDVFQLGWGARQRQVHANQCQHGADAGAIVDALFPPGANGRIPVIAVTGTNGKTTTTLLIANVFRTAGWITGAATTGGIFIDNVCVDPDDCTGYWSARTVLCAPQVQAAVLETARGGILKRGLGFDRCDVAVVLNVTADHLGQDGVDTVDDLAQVKSILVKVADRAVVLNAQDPHCVAMAAHAGKGVEVIYFSCDANNRVLQCHLHDGGRAVYLLNGDIVLADRAGRRVFFRADSLAVTLLGQARHNIANTLAAIAALVAQGDCSHEAIREGIRSFSCSAEKNPLRMNVFKVAGITVLLDYAHNVAAYQAILHTARAMSSGRVVGVVTAPGDRRDADLRQIAGVCAGGLDEMVVYETDNDDRGRARGETARILLEGAQAATQGKIPVRAVTEVREAIWEAFQQCTDGDLLLVSCATHVKELELALAQGLLMTPPILQELKIA